MLTSLDIQNMSDEERARHLAEFDAALEAYNERKTLELDQLEAKVLQMEALAARREEFARRLKAQIEAAEEEDAALRHEKELILAA